MRKFKGYLFGFTAAHLICTAVVTFQDCEKNLNVIRSSRYHILICAVMSIIIIYVAHNHFRQISLNNALVVALISLFSRIIYNSLQESSTTERIDSKCTPPYKSYYPISYVFLLLLSELLPYLSHLCTLWWKYRNTRSESLLPP